MVKQQKRRQPRQRVTPLMIVAGAIVITLLIVGVIWWATVQSKGSPTFMGLLEQSYDGGATEARYPGEAGRRWFAALGDPDAPVTVMEFSDFGCSHCRDYNQEVLETILNDYVATGKVRYVGHSYSFQREDSLKTSQAALCAAEQQRYFAFEHAMFQLLSTGSSNVETAARSVGIDLEPFRTCVSENRYEAALQDAIADAQSLGIEATPSFLVNGKLITGYVPGDLERAIEDALKSKP